MQNKVWPRIPLKLTGRPAPCASIGTREKQPALTEELPTGVESSIANSGSAQGHGESGRAGASRAESECKEGLKKRKRKKGED